MRRNRPKPNLRLSIPVDSIQQKQNNQLNITNELQGLCLDPEQKNKFTEALQSKSYIGELNHDDFESICELGSGSSGCVMKVKHKPTNTIMARKMIHLEVKASVRNLILRELKTLNQCQSPFIVTYHGSFYFNREINVCMEHMNCGSLDSIITNFGYIPENITSKITRSVLEGLYYLKTNLNVLHRDIKPSNILINTKGEIKICDFGVSGQLIDSMANSFVGTRSYMAPERLQGAKYDQRSDIWSLGLSIVEMCIGIYPIPPPHEDEINEIMRFNVVHGNQKRTDSAEFTKYNLLRQPKPMAIFELLDNIVNDEPVKLPSQYFSKELCDIVVKCLMKNPLERPDIKMLLDIPYIINVYNTEPSVENWVNSLDIDSI